MKTFTWFFLLTCFIVSSCNPHTTSEPIGSFTIEYTFAVIPYLAQLYDCSGLNVINAVQHPAALIDSHAVDLAVRLGQPKELSSPAFKIGSEELLIVVNPKNPVNSLTAEQVRGIFTGQVVSWNEILHSIPSAPIQVWVFSSGEDVQQVFDQAILAGSPITTMARLATSPDEMAGAISVDVNSIGILPGDYGTGIVSEVFSIGMVPVLVITGDEPNGEVQRLIACLQK
jgi:hypothetical protein